MKQIVFGSLLMLALAGCSKSGPDGEKVSVNPTTGDMTVTDKDGRTTEVKNEGDGWSAKSSDGSELKYEDGKMTGKNEKGETFESGAVAVTEAQLGLPFYPGSTAVENGSAKMETAEGTTFSVNRMTADMPDKVIAFYKSKFTNPQDFNSSANGGFHAQVGGKLADGAEGAVIAIRDKGATETQVLITLQRKAGR